jgi:hypothetical protein
MNKAQPQTFLGERGAHAANVKVSDVYRIVLERLQYFHPDRCDPDAFCQAVCCEIEKLNGTYPNVPGLEATDD